MENLINAIPTLGFPIIMCILMGLWIKQTHDDHREDIKRIQDNHNEESANMIAAINNNTLVIQKLVDRMETPDEK